MITGEVTASREIVVSFTVRDSDDLEHSIRAVVDTGFSGHLTLPQTTIASLDLSKSGDVTVILGNGTEAYLPKYDATIIWDGRDREISVYEADGDPLIGMKLLYGFDFHVHVVDGGMIALNRLP